MSSVADGPRGLRFGPGKGFQSQLFHIPPRNQSSKLFKEYRSKAPELREDDKRVLIQLVQDALLSAEVYDQRYRGPDMNVGGILLSILIAFSGSVLQAEFQRLLDSSCDEGRRPNEFDSKLLLKLMFALLFSRRSRGPIPEEGLSATRSLGLQLIHLLQPGLFEYPEPHIFDIGANAFLLAFPFSGSWHFTESFNSSTLPQSCCSCDVTPWLTDALAPQYSATGGICLRRNEGGDMSVHTGCAVSVVFYDCAAKLKAVQSSMLNATDKEIAAGALRTMQLPDTLDYIEWLLRKGMDELPDIMILRHCHGLTHPQVPFAVSSSPVIIEDVEVADQIKSLFPQLLLEANSNLVYSKPMFIPISFEIAVSDADADLQRACLEEARGCPHADIVLETALERTAREFLDEYLQEVEDVGDSKMAELSSSVSVCVRKAVVSALQAKAVMPELHPDAGDSHRALPTSDEDRDRVTAEVVTKLERRVRSYQRTACEILSLERSGMLAWTTSQVDAGGQAVTNALVMAPMSSRPGFAMQRMQSQEREPIELAPLQQENDVSQLREPFAEDNEDEAGDDSSSPAARVLSSLQAAHLLEFSRDPECFHNALDSCTELEDCRMALRSHGFNSTLPSGARAFLQVEQYQAALFAIHLRGISLRPRHVLVSEQFKTVVTDIPKRLPRHEKVKCKGSKLVPLNFADALLRQADTMASVSRTFLNFNSLDVRPEGWTPRSV